VIRTLLSLALVASVPFQAVAQIRLEALPAAPESGALGSLFDLQAETGRMTEPLAAEPGLAAAPEALPSAAPLPPTPEQLALAGRVRAYVELVSGVAPGQDLTDASAAKTPEGWRPLPEDERLFDDYDAFLRSRPDLADAAVVELLKAGLDAGRGWAQPVRNGLSAWVLARSAALASELAAKRPDLLDKNARRGMLKGIDAKRFDVEWMMREHDIIPARAGFLVGFAVYAATFVAARTLFSSYLPDAAAIALNLACFGLVYLAGRAGYRWSWERGLRAGQFGPVDFRAARRTIKRVQR
jgi:hypothetical protein